MLIGPNSTIIERHQFQVAEQLQAGNDVRNVNLVQLVLVLRHAALGGQQLLSQGGGRAGGRALAGGLGGTQRLDRVIPLRVRYLDGPLLNLIVFRLNSQLPKLIPNLQ